jgi:predicted nucleic acid-binding protein
VIVVSDTTAITSLLKLGEAELLRMLFGEVLIPSAVQAELFSYHGRLPDWLNVRMDFDRKVLKTLSRVLDAGEAEAIALAKAIGADLLIIDEKRGRVIAEDLGLRCLGLAGALLLTKQRGLIGSLKDMLSRLEDEANFYLAASVKDKLLAVAGETPDSCP